MGKKIEIDIQVKQGESRPGEKTLVFDLDENSKLGQYFAEKDAELYKEYTRRSDEDDGI